MPSSFKNRYIAAGFLHDAEKLLNDFTAENTVEFKVFASVWRKHHFSLIYMGRPNERELSEFTSEIFRISMQFLDTGVPFLQNVGGVYLLYGLFRNQILNPPVRIRVILSDFRNFLRIRHTAAVAAYRSLHYVIDYMIENSFNFVGAPRLLGPVIPRGPSKQKAVEKVSGLEERIESEMSKFVETKVLESVNELSKEIAEISERLPIKIDSASQVDYTEAIE
ncbi:snRNA-activating protein complex subunit 1, partial [Stegodyphus mimosarum]